MSVILSNQIRCTICGDTPYSAHRHDFQYCECGKVAVDGGMSYLRRVGDKWEDMSVVISQDLFDTVNESIQWSDDNGRNNLGLICKLFRDFRDKGYKVEQKK